MSKQRSTLSKQHSTLSKVRNFNAKLVRHCCRFWQQSRTLLRHCCWCGPGLTYRPYAYGVHLMTYAWNNNTNNAMRVTHDAWRPFNAASDLESGCGHLLELDNDSLLLLLLLCMMMDCRCVVTLNVRHVHALHLPPNHSLVSPGQYDKVRPNPIF